MAKTDSVGLIHPVDTVFDNQVYLLDKRFVDPRRPRGAPSKDDQAEMLPPYSEELIFLPHQYASHKELIEGLKGQHLPLWTISKLKLC